MGQKLLVASTNLNPFYRLIWRKLAKSQVTMNKHPANNNNFRSTYHSFVDVFEKYGNPFTEESQDVTVSDSRDIVGHHVIETISIIERIGKEQFQAFLSNRLILKEESLYDPIKQNSFSIFSTPKRRKGDSKTNEIKTLKKSCQLFVKLCISCQVRDGNIEDFSVMKIIFIHRRRPKM